ncbi:MarR family winged helix-turn-helix transcriptional regulator [Ensifer adhaerens]|uniref:MarR family winged helix-turn-helix transcriptional regulator n=1 Tax=Ensifer adhaerens TaxID=106592 RepID=UPI0015C40702|nr:MarR family transcriptional regulator [Ensifer adhaerens]
MTSSRFINLVAALGTALADAQGRACESTGVLQSDAAALITVGYHPGMSVGALAPIIGFTQSAAVRSVGRLVSQGLIERGRARDKRQVELTLTPAGASLREKILAARQRAVETATAALDPWQQVDLEPMVERMLAALTRDRESADHICRLCDETVCTPDTCPVERVAVLQEAKS